MRTQNTEIATNIGSILLVLGAIVAFVIKFTSLKEKTEFRISATETCINELKKETCLLREKVNNNDVVVMEIRTKLDNIEAMLLEMRK